MAGAASPNGGATLQRWLTIGATVIGLLVPLLGGGWWLSNLNGRVSALENDRAQRQGTEGELQMLRLGQAEDCRQLSTVEVQFGTVETVINKTQVANQRDIALLWEKVFSEQYPDTFYAVSIPHEAMPCLR